MARQIGKLSALAVQRLTKKGRYSDGGGLYLQITVAGVKSWLFRFMKDGAAREMGLGPLHSVSLAEARAKALACRQELLARRDPLEVRRSAALREKAEAAKAVTFAACAEMFIAAHKAGWRNPKHAAQWKSTLATYAEPIIGQLSVAATDTDLVLKVLQPIWTTKNETASRVRGRIEAVLDWAKVRGLRQGENPARWRGHLDKLLPPRSKVRKVNHHPALPYDELPAFMKALGKENGVAARALEFPVLTAARTGEVIGARRPQFNLKDKVWTVPADRIKGEKEHRVPLSKPAVAVAKALKDAAGEFVFPGGKSGRPLSNGAFRALLKRMGKADLIGHVTAHGFRSTFRDWAAEQTSYPGEVVEMALAHVISDKTEAAYRRGDLFQKRRRLMEDWAEYYLATKKGKKATPVTKSVAAEGGRRADRP